MSLRNKAFSGVIWTFTQQFGNQLIAFVVSLVLARLLLPREFGLIGMISIFIGIGRVLLDSGLTQSLIRSEDPDEEDYSTVFYFNLIASTIIYGITFFLAPLIANFYEQPILISLVRLYCLTFIFGGLGAVQQARLTKLMHFRTQTLITIPAMLLGGLLGITMAYLGYGVYSLVWSQIVTSILSSAQLWYYSKWTPQRSFDLRRFRTHFNFGYKITLSSLLDKIFANLYLIVIGKFFSASQVGYYTRAEATKKLPVNNLSAALNKVTFPLFASIQDDNERLKGMFKKLMQMVVFLVAPALIFMAVLGEPIFRFLFTEKWLPAVPYFQILCITGILQPVHAYNLNVLKVKGRSDLFLKIGVINKIVILVGVAIGLQFGIYGLLYSQVVLSFITFFINASYTVRFIAYPVVEQLKDIIPIILLATFTGSVVFFVDHLIMAQWDIIRILIGGITGVTMYGILSYYLKMESFIHFRKILGNKTQFHF